MNGSFELQVKSGTATLWSIAVGQGPTVLMFNGGPGCDDYLSPVSALVEDKARLIRFEPRGCGRSDWDGNYSLDVLLDDADAVRRAHGAQTCLVAGHSFGANAALAYALRFPSVVCGIIGMAGGKLVNDRSWSEAYHRGLQEVGEDSGGAVFHVDPRVNRDGNQCWRDFIRQPSLFRTVADLDLPATFINGSADIRPNWPTRQLAALLPQGHYVEIAGAAHYIWLTHPGELEHHLRHAIDRDSSTPTETGSEVPNTPGTAPHPRSR